MWCHGPPGWLNMNTNPTWQNKDALKSHDALPYLSEVSVEIIRCCWKGEVPVPVNRIAVWPAFSFRMPVGLQGTVLGSCLSFSACAHWKEGHSRWGGGGEISPEIREAFLTSQSLARLWVMTRWQHKVKTLLEKAENKIRAVCVLPFLGYPCFSFSFPLPIP